MIKKDPNLVVAVSAALDENDVPPESTGPAIPMSLDDVAAKVRALDGFSTDAKYVWNDSYRFHRPAPITRRALDGVRRLLARFFPAHFDPPAPTPPTELFVPRTVVVNVLDLFAKASRPVEEPVEEIAIPLESGSAVIYARKREHARGLTDLGQQVTKAELGQRLDEDVMSSVVTYLFERLREGKLDMLATLAGFDALKRFTLTTGEDAFVMGLNADGMWHVEVNIGEPEALRKDRMPSMMMGDRRYPPRFEARLMSADEIQHHICTPKGSLVGNAKRDVDGLLGPSEEAGRMSVN